MGLTGPKPVQVVDVLPWDFDFHAPHTRDDVHRQHDSTKHGQLAQYIRCLLLALVHADADLREIV